MSEQGGAGVVENTHFSLPVRGEEAEEEYKILIPLYQSESIGGGTYKKYQFLHLPVRFCPSPDLGDINSTSSVSSLFFISSFL